MDVHHQTIPNIPGGGYDATKPLCGLYLPDQRLITGKEQEVTGDSNRVTCMYCKSEERYLRLKAISFTVAGLSWQGEGKLDAQTLWEGFRKSNLWFNPNDFWSSPYPLAPRADWQIATVQKVEAAIPDRFKKYIERKRKQSAKLLSKVNTLVMYTLNPKKYKTTVERYARKLKLVRIPGRKLIVRAMPDPARRGLAFDDCFGVQDCWYLAECDPSIVWSYRDRYQDDWEAFVESAVYFLYEEPKEA